MADQAAGYNPNHAQGTAAQQGIASIAPKPAMPFLTVTISGSDGTQPAKPVGAPITIQIPSQLSLRIASMHVMEFVMKEFKRIGFKDALKAIGLK